MLALKSNRVFFSISKLKNDCKDSGSMNRTGVWVKKEKNYIYIYIYIYIPETEAKRRKNYIYTGKKCIDKLQLPCAEKCIDLIFKSLIITRLKSVLTKI